MKKKTYLANAIEIANMKAQYDSEAKKLVADKKVLAWILKYTVREIADCTLKEIEAAIEDIEVAAVPIYPGRKKKEAVMGTPTQDSVPNEGTITYDVRFYVITPGGERLKLILNIEIQRNYYPGYDLVPRAVFYCARMLSAQLNTEFTAENYDDIKKVYSIWLCLNSPKKEADTIVEYRIKPEVLYGLAEAGHRCDLLSVVLVGLSEAGCIREETPLQGFLGTIFSEKLRPEEKLQILEEKYEIAATEEVKEGVNRMCNLSDAIEERGMQKGIQKGIQKGLQKGEQLKLIELICRKVKKGKKPEVIAEELEEDIASVSAIYEAVLKAAPDYNSGRVYELLNKISKDNENELSV